MAARKSDEPAPAATVRTQEYAAGVGWSVGETAPQDAFRSLDGDGHNTPVGSVVHEHPGGHARLIVAKGALITAGVRMELDAAEAESDEG